MLADQGSKGDKPSSARTTQTDAPQPGIGITAPAIALPKGGGAIRGMGEKFAANPVTGTGSMSVPIATSPGRGGFGPQLSLSYDSGAGNGPFGLGWNLSLPAITRKTDKGLPQYRDAEESDVFILSGAEDLVPMLMPSGERFEDSTTFPGFVIHRYRPRIEGLFARIERWTNTMTGETHWRSITKDNITTLYGKDNDSRIFDPADADPAHPTRIFTWLISESYDDKGNAILYTYKDEDSEGVARSAVHERNRLTEATFAQRYLKRIHYGNRTPRLANEDFQQRRDWLFEVVFDYGEHYQADLQHQPIFVDVLGDLRTWAVRADAFSTCRAGFEVRTYRLCQRVLMFHHFPPDDPANDPDEVDEAAVGKNCLVRATEFSHKQTPMATYLVAATQAAFQRNDTGGYNRRALPPLQFEYSKAQIQAELKTVDAASLENLPTGIDGAHYQFVDLYGEGISGVLTQQAEGWFYKRNLSPLTMQTVDDANGKTRIAIDARFAPLERVAFQPSPGNLNGGQQLLDLDGDGRTDLVQFAPPLAGYSAQDKAGAWQPFVPFRSHPNLDWQDPNLRHVELTGDGHADVLITQAGRFEWYRSLDKDGFAPAQFVTQPLDDELGPRLLFADGTQSVYLADMNGDGLTDLVRIGNGNICYWPSLGYGRFGAKVTMSHAPYFDHPDQFDHQRIRIADIDGSGVVDILYIGRAAIQIYRNESGNRWADADVITNFPRVDNLASVQTMDLLGNGTACLVWSSPLSRDARQPMRYLDLLGGQKPHLLVRTINNLGAETHVQYAPSTKFYLQDKYAGKPWITKLPFPVHCVEKVTVTDKWRKSSFSTTYSYHHGYFDGNEREFRGFGRVEQVDVESYGEFAAGNVASPYITTDKTLYQPPIKTITWYHTGFAAERDRILSAFAQEYCAVPGFAEHQLPQPTLTADDFTDDFTTDEWREAARACKGMVLRQEVYELDVDALEQGKHLPVRLFSTAFHNSNIQRLQPQGHNRHAVFLVTESEAITYNYELDLKQSTPDPRIAHTLNLRFDNYGRALQTVAVTYPRQVVHTDPTNTLTPAQHALIQNVQDERHLAYTETHYTVELPDDPHQHRLPAPCEVLTYELTGANSAHGFTPSTGHYFSLDDLRAFALSDTLPGQGIKPVTKRDYHQQPLDNTAHQRIVEWVRLLYFKDDLSGASPFGQSTRLGLPYETYKLALTDDLLNAVFLDASGNKLDRPVRDTTTARQLLAEAGVSGYLSGADLAARFAPIPAAELAGQYWMRSGTAGFASDAAQHFYLPERYTDPFGNVTTLEYDARDLFIRSSSDMLGNTTRVLNFDYRVLAPSKLQDINDNETEAYFDILGRVVATAVKGKGNQGDTLNNFNTDLADPPLTERVKFFFADALYDQSKARFWLNNATARHVYYFGETLDANGNLVWGTHPARACAILREKHVAQLQPATTTTLAEESALQVVFECSDGHGAVLLKKVQAEPAAGETVLRWIASGKTILNNKGKPVKQYEPYFSTSGHRCEEPREEGVTPVLYYDAAGRLVRTELPDGTFSRVEFSPWHVQSYDANDTVKKSQWYRERLTLNERSPDSTEFDAAEEVKALQASLEDKRAARLAAQHANTPALTILDSLGRDVIAIAHNRTPDANDVWQDDFPLTYTKLDAEGKPLWIRDARGNLVMQYISPAKANNDPSDAMPANAVPCYDIAGNLLFQHSMDAGDRWMLMDAAGKPMVAWDRNQRQISTAFSAEDRRYFTQYDALHRPVEQWLRSDGDAPKMIERFEYQDAQPNDAKNLNGQLIRHYDPSGRVETVRRDFKGNVLETQRRLNNQPKQALIDWQTNPEIFLESAAETFTQMSEFDALNRMTKHYNWHRPLPNNRVAVIEPTYNERGLLLSENLTVRASKTADGFDSAVDSKSSAAIREVRYNVKGQKEFLQLGNGTLTQYDYDAMTFRLKQIRTTRPADDADFPGRHSNLADARIVQQLHYTYDPVGNITEIYDEAYEPVFFQNQQVESRNRYEYDALYRLTRATGRENGALRGAPTNLEVNPVTTHLPIQRSDPNALRNYTQTYRYDAVGNIAQMHHEAGMGRWTRDYTYATDSNRLLSTQQGNETIIYDYDTHGNMRNLANLPDAYRIQWDQRDMIHNIDLGGGGQAYYQYDAGKQRTRKRIENQNGLGGYWERIYLGGYELYRRYRPNDPTPVEEIESLHLFEGEQRVLLVDDVLKTDRTHADGRPFSTDPIMRYQYGNHLGSVGVELDESAQVISYEEFHPYGTSAYRLLNSATEAPPKRYRYTGMERDEESGLSYHGARYYAPWVGRWVSCDPAGLTSNLNCYLAMSSNPVRYSDPDGRDPTEPKPSPTILINKGTIHVEGFQRKYTPQGLTFESAPGGQFKGSAFTSAKWTFNEGVATFKGSPIEITTAGDLHKRDFSTLLRGEEFGKTLTEGHKIGGFDMTFTEPGTVKDVRSGKPFLTTWGGGHIDRAAGMNRLMVDPATVNVVEKYQDYIQVKGDFIDKPPTPASPTAPASGPRPVEVIKFSTANAAAAASPEGPDVASVLSKVSSVAKTGVGGVLIVGGGVGSVVETVKAANKGDEVETIWKATLASVQLTGAAFWLSGLAAGEAGAGVMTLGARVAMVGSIPGLFVAALWPSSVADGTFLKASYEPDDQPNAVSSTPKVCK